MLLLAMSRRNEHTNLGVIVERIKDGTIIVTDPSSVGSLLKGFFGSQYGENKSRLQLMPEEALYMLDVRNAQCTINNAPATFNEIADYYKTKEKFLARYFCYRDWRDRSVLWRQ